MSAILFGSISTIADTSELQREAFNRAFAEHGLDWRWEQEEYAELLRGSGGAQRIAEYARARGQEVDAATVHLRKSELFQQLLGEAPQSARPGVVETMQAAKRDGAKVALVTTTAPENVAGLIAALEPPLATTDFDLIVDVTSVDQPKPDKAAYAFALEHLGEDAGACVAIEDNVGGVEAAKAAGLECVAFPNENTAGHGFEAADHRVDHLAFAELRSFIPNA